MDARRAGLPLQGVKHLDRSDCAYLKAVEFLVVDMGEKILAWHDYFQECISRLKYRFAKGYWGPPDEHGSLSGTIFLMNIYCIHFEYDLLKRKCWEHGSNLYSNWEHEPPKNWERNRRMMKHVFRMSPKDRRIAMTGDNGIHRWESDDNPPF